MFDFRKLEAFCKVCELSSFSKAGEALFLSQPTVSAHIQALEKELNVRLLDRMAKGVLPTQAGHLLWKKTKLAFGQLESAKEEISTLSSQVVGDIVLGSTTVPAHHVLPSLLTHFLELYPKVRPSLVIGSSQDILRKVTEGEIMAGIVDSATSNDPDLRLTPLIEDEIIIVAPPATDMALPLLSEGPLHPHLPTISFDTATELDWILQEERSHTRQSFENALRQAEYEPRKLIVRLAVDNSHSALQYVAAGLGVSIASRIAVGDVIRFKGLCALSIQHVYATQQFACAINKKRTMFPATSIFLEFLHTATRHLRKVEPI